MANTVVVLKEKYGPYNAGEIAGFPSKTADKIVRAGRAEYYEEQKKSALRSAVTKRSAPKTSPKKEQPKTQKSESEGEQEA